MENHIHVDDGRNIIFEIHGYIVPVFADFFNLEEIENINNTFKIKQEFHNIIKNNLDNKRNTGISTLRYAK